MLVVIARFFVVSVHVFLWFLLLWFWVLLSIHLVVCVLCCRYLDVKARVLLVNVVLLLLLLLLAFDTCVSFSFSIIRP